MQEASVARRPLDRRRGKVTESDIEPLVAAPKMIDRHLERVLAWC
jgi:hypothetical protein